ncbi:MAG: EAL domain-containing protein, partial [Deltaproteobacteria bacterium]|nr:EAL domain-containing protein [Deltaproteobacteria bacterium]
RDISARLIEISASLLESATGEILLTELEDDRPAASNGMSEDADSDEMSVQAVADSVDDESSTLAGLRIGVEDLDTLLTEADAFLARGNHTAGIEMLERAADLHPSEKAPLCRLQTIHEECADWAALAEVNRRLASVPTPGSMAPCDDPLPSIPATALNHGEDPDVLAAPDSPLLADAPATSAVEPEADCKINAGDFDVQIVIDEKEMGATGEQAPAKETGFRSALTGLPLRDLFLDRVDRAIARKDRIESYKFAVLVLDIDRFKRINDEFGLHQADEMLVAVAQRLEKCLRKSDTAAYLGGDEFGVLLENLRGEHDAIRLARKITRRLSSPFELNGREVEISASIGVALSATGYDRPEKLLQDADAAMFRAKANGGGSTELFDESLRTRAAALLELETNLRRALDAGEFLIHYQPIVALGSGRVVGFEALARWQHPEGNLIAPNDFIPMAEEIDLIGPIEKWLIGEACRQLGEWQRNHPEEVPLTMNVNVSGKHLAQESFIGHLEEALSESGIEQGTLIFEVTEKALLENAGILPALMPKLEALRVRLSVDDFGSSLSSLSLLQRYPFAALKIDAARAANGGAGFEGPGFFGADMIRALISLARILGSDSVVKNVEREEQLAELRETGCDHAQGHLFCRAVDDREASGLIGETLPRTPPVES